MLCVKTFSFWLVGWLWRFWIHRPWHLQIYAHLQMVIETYPHHLSQYLHLLFIFAGLTGRKKRLLCWNILRSDSVFPVVLNQLPLGSERLEWVSSPLPKDVKTSALRESAGWSRMSQSLCVRSSRCMSSGQGLWHPSSIPSFPSCLLMMLVEQLL